MTEALSSSIRVTHPRDLISLQQPAGFNATHINYHLSFRAIRSILSRSHNANALNYMNGICIDKPLSIRITGLGDIYKGSPEKSRLLAAQLVSAIVTR